MWTPEDDERDLPQPIDLDDDAYDDEVDTMECPGCGAEVYEGTPRCPECGQWLFGADSPAARRARGWFWPVTVGILVALIVMFWAGLARL